MKAGMKSRSRGLGHQTV